MAHRGRTGAVVGQQPFGGARASGTNHKATEAGMNRPELHRRDLRFRCFRRLRELPVYAAVKGPASRLTSRLRWAARLARRSSSNASTMDRSSTTTGVASPASAATLAAAAARR